MKDLYDAVAAVCPIFGVSVGRHGDKATWRIDFQPEATAEQRAAAQTVIDNFDLSDAAQSARQKSARKGETAAKLTSGDPISMAVRSGINATRNHLRGNDNAMVDKINEIIAKMNEMRNALKTALNLTLSPSIQPLPRFQSLTRDEEFAKFMAELENE